MEITYDKDVDVMYIELRKGEFHKNRKLDSLTILDLDKDGKILGIELLDASKRIQGALPKIHLKNLVAVSD